MQILKIRGRWWSHASNECPIPIAVKKALFKTFIFNARSLPFQKMIYIKNQIFKPLLIIGKDILNAVDATKLKKGFNSNIMVLRWKL